MPSRFLRNPFALNFGTLAVRSSTHVLSRGTVVPDIYLNFSHFLDHFLMLIFAKAAYDAGQYFGLEYQDIIIYGTLGLFLFGAAAPIAAWSADWLSRSLLMIIGLLGMGASCVFIAFAESPMQLGVGLTCLGLFAAIHHPVGVPMLVKRPGAVGVRLGVHGVWGNMGVAAAPLVTGLLLTFGDWRLAFVVPGVICLLFGWAFWVALEDDTASNSGKNSARRIDYADGWKGTLCILFMITSSSGFVFGTVIFVIPRYFETGMTGVTTDIALTGLLAAIVYAAASFSQIVTGWVSDRIRIKHILIFLSLGQALFLYLSSLGTDFALFFSCLAAMWFVFGQVPIADIVITRLVPDEARPKIMSIKFLLNLTIGAAALPFTSMLLQNGYGLSTLMLCLVPLTLLITFLSLLMRRL